MECKNAWSWNLHINTDKHKEQVVADNLKQSNSSQSSQASEQTSRPQNTNLCINCKSHFTGKFALHQCGNMEQQVSATVAKPKTSETKAKTKSTTQSQQLEVSATVAKPKTSETKAKTKSTTQSQQLEEGNTLFVYGIPKISSNWQVIRNYFDTTFGLGQVKFVRMNVVNEKTLGAYVDFHNRAAALTAYNGGFLMGNISQHYIDNVFVKCKLLKSEENNPTSTSEVKSTGNQQQIDLNTLYVFGLPKNFPWPILHGYFENKYGHVKYASKRSAYGRVEFQTRAAALAAYSGGFVMNDNSQHNIEGVVVRCKIHSTEEKSSVQASTSTSRESTNKVVSESQQTISNESKKLFVVNVMSYTRDDLLAHFIKYGNIERLDMPRNCHYCFIHYQFAADAQAAYLAGEITRKGKDRKHNIGPQHVLVRLNLQKELKTKCKKHATVQHQEHEMESALSIALQGVMSYSEATLQEYFSKYGEIVQVQKAYNKDVPLDFGFVKFKTPQAAEKAFQSGQVHETDNKLRVHIIGDGFVILTYQSSAGKKDSTSGPKSSYQEASTSTSRESTNKVVSESQQNISNESKQLFVVNVMYYTRDDLLAHFIKYGKIERLDMPRNCNYCFVHYQFAADAQAAYLAGEITRKGKDRKHNIGPQHVWVRLNLQKELEPKCKKHATVQHQEHEMESPLSIALQGVMSYSEATLQEYFSKYGEIVEVQKAYNKDVPLDFGFVKFKTPQAAEKAFQSGQVHETDNKLRVHIIGHELVILTYQSSSGLKDSTSGPKGSYQEVDATDETIKENKESQQRGPCRELFIPDTGNYSFAEIKLIFENYGCVTNVEMHPSRNGIPFCFVCFESVAQATAAFEEGEVIPGRKERLLNVEDDFLLVSYKGEEDQEPLDRRLYIGGDISCTGMETLTTYFEQYGMVKSFKVPPKHDQVEMATDHRDYCYITFATAVKLQLPMWMESHMVFIGNIS
ncbi:uncharacterized protein [Amphiura filiformis]|uniref:uncharacterized protein isoform X2 n=1 Tax=Amphiura filiformis TaxID=82378 RepID=UPI003B224203